MAESFSTEVNATDEATVIHVRGEIDMATAGRLRDVIEPHMGPKQKIILDFSEVEFMDSSCLKVLVQARGRLTEDGGSLILRNPSKAAHRLLTVAAPTTSSKLTPRITPQIQTDPLPGGPESGPSWVVVVHPPVLDPLAVAADPEVAICSATGALADRALQGEDWRWFDEFGAGAI